MPHIRETLCVNSLNCWELLPSNKTISNEYVYAYSLNKDILKWCAFVQSKRRLWQQHLINRVIGIKETAQKGSLQRQKKPAYSTPKTSLNFCLWIECTSGISLGLQ